jgi:hypothetical protein
MRDELVAAVRINDRYKNDHELFENDKIFHRRHSPHSQIKLFGNLENFARGRVWN